MPENSESVERTRENCSEVVTREIEEEEEGGVVVGGLTMM
jgi:hypothetical protein